MRLNEPITAVETELVGDEPIMSRTDANGQIMFVNHVFEEVSGFSEAELIGAPHNLVRHPHMPAQAFANLWATIKAGRPWDGLVKNRAKNGNFYWVRANVTPLVENDAVVGYISIRSRPSRDAVAAAEQTYRAIREGTAKDVMLRDGELVAHGSRARLLDLWRSVAGRMAFAALAAFLVIAAVGWLGFSGMMSSNIALRNVYENDLVSVDQLRGIVDRIRDNRNHMAQMTIALGHGEPADQVLKERVTPINANLAQIAGLWRDYTARPRLPDQLALIAKFDQSFGVLLHDGIEPALALAQKHNVEALNQLFEKRLPPMFQAVFDGDRDLVARQVQVGRDAYLDAVANLRWRLIVGLGLTALGLCALFATGSALFASVRRPMRALERHLQAVTRSELDRDIATPAVREFRGVYAMLRAMRAHLVFAAWQRREFESKTDEIRRQTVEAMARRIETEAGGAVERVGTRANIMREEANQVTASVERVNANTGRTADAVDQALKNAQIVAAASEELAASIREVAAQVDHASTVARDASRKGNDARETIRSLSDAGDRIHSVVRLIAEIASQTNLLALNATIEAARAGEAGRGFAVVANEVKALATQTAHATTEIARQIEDLRAATAAAVTQVDAVGHTLDAVAEVSISVAAAIEQQTSATHEIARNVAESSQAVQRITDLMAEVASEATAAGQQVGDLRANAGVVADDVAALRTVLVQTVRTASKEADRRVQSRVVVDIACAVDLAGRSGTIPGRLCDVSPHGASIDVDATRAAEAGTTGNLILTHAGDARARFTIRSVGPPGRLHVAFDANDLQTAFTSAVARLMEAGKRTVRAA
jgi:aerotaxis receptor